MGGGPATPRIYRQPAALSGYRIMWLFVLFDLPVGTKKERKAATKFRLSLLDMGFEMSQFSVYLKFCAGKEQGDALAGRSRRRCRPRVRFISSKSPTSSTKISAPIGDENVNPPLKCRTNWHCFEARMAFCHSNEEKRP